MNRRFDAVNAPISELAQRANSAAIAPAWAEDRFIAKAAYDAMPKDERALIDSDPNKWEWDWASERYYNAQHAGNEEWLMLRQAAEAAGMARR